MQIKTAVLDASTPLGLGYVMNVAAKSGTNRLSGAASGLFQPSRWIGSNVQGGAPASERLYQVDLALGGPIERDKWWYYGSYRRLDAAAGVTRTAEDLAILRALVPDFEPFDADNDGNFYFIKSVRQLSRNHQLSGFYQNDRNVQEGLAARSVSPSYARRGGAAVMARLQSVLGKTTTARVSFSFNNKTTESIVQDLTKPTFAIFQQFVVTGGRPAGQVPLASAGTGSTSFDRPASQWQLAADVVKSGVQFLGTHDLQLGMYLDPALRVKSDSQYVNGGFVREEFILRSPSNLAGGVRPFRQTHYDVSEAVTQSTVAEDYAAYVQDTWRIRPNLTVTLGLRADVIRRRDDVFALETQRSTDFGPRFGVNYLLGSSGRTSIRASWGRIHELLEKGSAAFSSEPGFRDLYDIDGDGVFETTFVTPPANSRTGNREIDVSRHQPYVNQLTLGFGRQLPHRMAVEVGYVRREYRDRWALVEVNGVYSESNVFLGYRDLAQNEIYRVTNNEWNWQVFNGLEMTITQQTGRLQFIASYGRQWQSMEGTWQPRDPAAILQPNAFANTGGLGNTAAPVSAPTDANSLSGTQSTGGTPWQDHVLRGGVSFQAPLGLLLSTTFQYQSGQWSGPIITRVTAETRYGPATVTLPNGRVVSNPLATPNRFVGETRTDQQFTLPAYHTVSLRVGRRFSIGRLNIDGGVEAFNLFNEDADVDMRSGGNQTFNPNYRLTQTPQRARSGQLAFRVTF